VLGVLCVDDRLNEELFAAKGYWSRSISQRDQDLSFQAADTNLFVVVTVLAHLGYFLGLKKRVFVPVTSIVYLGMLVDSVAQAFPVPKENLREKFARLRESILTLKSSVRLKSIQPLSLGQSFTLERWSPRLLGLPKVQRCP